MLTVAGRRGRRVGGELSWGGLEGGEREATRALSLAALGSEAARAAARAACSATAALRVQLAPMYIYIFPLIYYPYVCIYIYSLWASASCRSGRLLSLFLAREDAGLCLLLRACTQSAPAHRGAAGMITRLARRPPATSASEAECQ